MAAQMQFTEQALFLEGAPEPSTQDPQGQHVLRSNAICNLSIQGNPFISPVLFLNAVCKKPTLCQTGTSTVFPLPWQRYFHPFLVLFYNPSAA